MLGPLFVNRGPSLVGFGLDFVPDGIDGRASARAQRGMSVFGDPVITLLVDGPRSKAVAAGGDDGMTGG